MSTLITINLSKHLHEALEGRARSNHRSLTDEATCIIKQAVLGHDARAVRYLRPDETQPLTLEELERALSDDRYGRLGTLVDLEELVDELRAERGEPSR